MGRRNSVFCESTARRHLTPARTREDEEEFIREGCLIHSANYNPHITNLISF